MEESALKIAKKSLKKAESGSLELKALAKRVVKKLSKNHPNVDVKTIQKLITSNKSSKKFVVEGKLVSLGTKRKATSSTTKNKKKEEGKPCKKQKTGEPSCENGDSSLSSLASVEDWRKQHKIVLKDTHDDDEGQKASKQIRQAKEYFPYRSFDAPGCVQHIAPALLRQCTEKNGFQKPSPIQAQCWPVLMESVPVDGETKNNKKTKTRDVVGIAETGSGKTLAFALPALSKLANRQKSKRRLPGLLVLSPTRELAMQSHEVLHEFGAVVGLRSLVVYGGVPKHTQTSELRRGVVDCIVATPGRLEDLVREGSCNLSQITSLVLDEADRMLDLGFEETVRFLIGSCRSCQDGRQTAMFSATWPAAIQRIALEYMVRPVRVYVGFASISNNDDDNGVPDDSLSANQRVHQVVEVVEDRARDGRLRQLLHQHHKAHEKEKNRVLVFALYKKEAERLEYSLKRDGWDCGSIHGNKNQTARTAALARFKDGSCPLLVATDVAARGLDIPNVGLVINYTFPLTIEDYVHRIGRTGRAGQTGRSHTFFQPTDKSHAGELQQVLRQAGQDVPDALLQFGSTIKKKEHKLYGNFGPKDGGPMKKATKITFSYSDNEDE